MKTPTAVEEDVRKLFAQLEASAPKPATDLVYTALTQRRHARARRLTFSAFVFVLVVVGLSAAVAISSRRTPEVEVTTTASEVGLALFERTSWTETNSTLGDSSRVVHAIDWTPPGATDRLVTGVIAFDTVNSGGTIVGEFWEDIDATGGSIDVTRVENEELIWRANPASAWTGEELLLVGGSNGPGVDTPAVAYNPSTDTWRELADPPGYDASPDAFSGPGFLIGGELFLPRAGAAYDPATDEWFGIAAWPFAEDRQVALIEEVPGGYVAWGGCSGPQCEDSNTNLRDDGMIYDAASDTWTEMAESLLPPSVDAVATWAAGELYVVVTFSENAQPQAATYNPTADLWTWLTAPPLSSRTGSDIVLSNGSIAIWGGTSTRDGGEALASGAVYSLANESWVLLPAAPTSATGHTMVDIGGLVYIAGGAESPLVLSIPDAGGTLYFRCIMREGFDPGFSIDFGINFAQVIWSDDGVPLAVKTGLDVPAEFHGPCIESIGGTDIGESSWVQTGAPLQD